ncbi:serine protease [Mycobacterium sp. M1]|uniref:Serine protease n=1 Tax=Mycolicibacter acidiphilus TaxID=2835306 RepID=A0ABS5RPJ1_9MYCO|nr:serine protease [Mycolicibacter acidiphilus]MBS9536221.1 serine protease [Mycolicibacter acidiphilus]
MLIEVIWPNVTAWADEKVSLGGGAGILVGDNHCTLTTVGHDNTGELVGFTSSHCGGPGAPVIAEGTDTTVGTVVAAKGVNGDLVYEVIKLDSAKVIPLANFSGFAINGIGPEPQYSQPACQQGAVTGFTCGTIGGRTGDPRVVNVDRLPFQSGDDGAPVTVDGFLVGMASNGYMHRVFWAPSVVPFEEYPRVKMIYFSAILDDVNASGGAGSGFTPIPA